MRPLVDLGKDMVPTYPNVVVASEAAMKTQAAQLRAFLAASFKALDRMQHDQTFGLSYLKTYTSETNDKINQQVYEQIIRTQPADGEIKPEGITEFRAYRRQGLGHGRPAENRPDDGLHDQVLAGVQIVAHGKS